jgi:hypothetical protein
MNEAQRIKAIKALVEKGDKAKDKAEQYYASAGCHLKALKDDASSKAEWEKLIKSKCGIGASRAYELIAIVDGRKTVADIRAIRARSRAKAKAVSSTPSGQNLPGKVEQKPEPQEAVAAAATTEATTEQLPTPHQIAKCSSREIMASEIERLASRLIDNDPETARALCEVLRNDGGDRLLNALGRGLGIDVDIDSDTPAPAAADNDDGLDIPDYLDRTKAIVEQQEAA